MKHKWMVIVLILALCSFSAQAEPVQGTEADQAQRWAKGITQTVDTVDVFAPVGGQLLASDVKVGDVVEAGASLFTIRPIQVLAPQSGVIRLLKAQVGDQASGVILQYGALCSIDRDDVHRVRATIAAAYNKPKNRAITLGETLRVYEGDSGDSDDPAQTLGTVIAVDGKGYVVEISAGVFELEDKVRLYRGEGDDYNAKDKVGEGFVERAKTVPVMADGVIAKIHVTEGQKVSRGDVLFTVDDASAVYKEPAEFTAVPPQGGVVSALYVQDGQQVRKDQLLLTLRPLDALEFVVDVDELDIPFVHAGQAMQVKVDALGENRIDAAVKQISPLGITVLDTTKYQVTLSIQGTPVGLLPGMHVTAYWQ
jgi:multidrug efflux pump subunit AcrA (membrane-fusion protein)